MIYGEISIVDVGNDVSIGGADSDLYEVRVGSGLPGFINRQQATNLKVALSQTFPSKVTVKNGLTVFNTIR